MSIASILHHTVHFGALAGVALRPLHRTSESRHRDRGWDRRWLRIRRDADLEAACSPAILSSGHIVLNVFLRRQP
jgi:hypothetical protein